MLGLAGFVNHIFLIFDHQLLPSVRDIHFILLAMPALGEVPRWSALIVAFALLLTVPYLIREEPVLSLNRQLPPVVPLHQALRRVSQPPTIRPPPDRPSNNSPTIIRLPTFYVLSAPASHSLGDFSCYVNKKPRFLHVFIGRRLHVHPTPILERTPHHRTQITD